MSNPVRMTIDPGGLTDAEANKLEGFLAQTPQLREQLVAWKQQAHLPLLNLPEADDLAPIFEAAEAISARAKGLIVLGTGGSSLGGQTLCALAPRDHRVHFIDNLDPHTMDDFLTRPDLADYHLLIISKSGGTLETLTQATVFCAAMARHHGADLSQRAHVITLPGDRPLRQLAAHYGIPVLDHDPGIGGRYSVLSLVGLLPARVAGVDIRAVRTGAARAMAAIEQGAEAASLTGAAWQAALMETRPISVLMPYCDRLKLFSAWYQQLWAESLGKSGKGSTPVAALGAVDQHSQLQLYLDGPADKSFTVMTLPHAGEGAPIPSPPCAEHDYLSGRKVGDVFAALQHGTVETLKRHHLPLRLCELSHVDAAVMGELLMHFMLETIATAQLLALNAFDQPAVEESKSITRARLKEQATQGAQVA